MEVYGERAIPHREVREGDRLRINRGFGRHQDVVVRVLIEQHVKKAEARVLYDDVTPTPTPEEIAQRRVERAYRAGWEVYESLCRGTVDSAGNPLTFG